MNTDEISFCTIYIIMYSIYIYTRILVKQVMRIKNLELKPKPNYIA